MDRRSMVSGALGLALGCSGMAGAPAQAEGAPLQSVGVFSLLGDSVRVVARQTQEVLFKDIGMDAIADGAAQTALLARYPQAKVTLFRPPAEVSVDEQRAIGAAAALDGKLPDWVAQKAQESALSHVLLIASSIGPMEFRTGRAQVVGNYSVTGVGFYVAADGRTTNTENGAVSNGYLAPFVQLRLVLVEVASRKVVGSASLSEGYIVGPPTPEAPDPWRFLDRSGKAQALQTLLKRTLSRGMESVLKAT